MSFECAVVVDGQRCRNPEPGDTTYLRVLTFCAFHQEPFEEVVLAKNLMHEIIGARIERSEFGQALRAVMESMPDPSETQPARQDLRYEATVYFFRCEEFVKIGYSIAPHMRLRAIQSADGTKYPEGMNYPTTSLIATEAGGYLREQELHAKFAHLRHTGEWFREAPELTDYINSLSKEAAA